MGGSVVDAEGDWDSIQKTTIVLVGKSGNGKSATGNSILGGKHFKSSRSQSSVTTTCQLATVMKEDGRYISVIDTPGLFDSTLTHQYLQEEISKCITLAREGIHAIVLVLSALNRFTLEEIAAVESLQILFGEKVLCYMIVLFTGGDELEDEGQTLEQYLTSSGETPLPLELQDLLDKCSGRKLVFNNKTRDVEKKALQTKTLIDMVDEVVAYNDGKPYTNSLFQEAQKLADSLAKEKKLESLLSTAQLGGENIEKKMLKEWKRDLEAAHSRQLKIVTDMVEEKLKISAELQQKILEDRLAEEKAAREIAERQAREAAAQASEEMDLLKKMLEEARQQREELEKKLKKGVGSPGCSIL